jgi:hypothetical protein
MILEEFSNEIYNGHVYKTLHKLPDLKDPHSYFLYSVSHEDGPATGVLLFNNEKAWFQSISMDISMLGEPSWRLYAIVQLTQEQLDMENYINKLQNDIVGDYCSYKEGVKGIYYNGNAYSKWINLTEKFWNKRRDVYYNYRENEVIGWFGY